MPILDMDSLIPQVKSIDNSMNPSRIFILRPIATSLLMVALLLSGLFAYSLLPISSLPQVDYPTIQVATFYPGASPEVMTSAITAPLERQFGQMPGLEQMSSTSSSGASMITLQFSLDLALDVAEQDVQAAINAATSYLPNDLPSPPVYNKVNPADAPIVTFAITSDTLPLAQVEDFADTKLSQKISQLPGVGLVSISGGQRPAVRIKVNPTALAAYGLTLENIRSIVAANNVNMPKGSFDGSRQSYTINTNDQLLSSVDYRSIIVAYKNNAPIRLSDVATVNDDIENVNQAAWANTKPAIILNIQRQPGANVIQIADSVKSLFTKLRATLPSAMKISLLTDRTITIRASVKDVQFELMLAVVLVVTVIFLFLRNLPATIIPSVSVPLSLIGTFGVMYFCGFSLNNLTLMGLTIATGFVVDDAIVMIENISRYIEQGVPPMQAALKGAAQIGFTIMSLTVALIAALIPLLFMTDVIGMLFREFAITVAVTILLSAVVSLTLTPMLCSRILRLRTEAEMSAFERRSAAILHKLINHYQTSLQWVLKHQRQTLWVALLTLTTSCLLFYFIPKGFFPVQDTGLIQGISEAKQTTSFSAMAERQQALAKVILADPGVANLSSFIGIDGVNNTLNSGRMLITLKPLEQRKEIASNIIQRLQTKLAQVAGITLYMQPVQDLTLDDRVTRTQYQYSLSTSNSTVLAHWTTLLVDKLHTAPQLLDVTSDQQNYGLETTINIDRDTASRLGISPQLIDDTLYDAFGQRQISTMFTQSNQYHVVLETMVPPENVNPLDNIYFNTTTGTVIPLKAFAQITHTIAPLLVTRQDQFPASIISFNLSSGTALSVATKIIQHAQQAIGIPDNVVTSFEGAAKIFQNSLNNELWLVIAAIIVIYIMLGVLYESYIHPITILSTLPSACLGAVLALFLCGTELSVIALIGVILLIGIVMKNAIMMIDFALEQERRYHKTAHDAIYEACILRFRPILMTTMASLLGAVPIAFSLGIGSELRRPLGIAIIGGLIVSQVLTLYTTPVIYLAFDRIAKKLAPTFNNNHDGNGEEQ